MKNWIIFSFLLMGSTIAAMAQVSDPDKLLGIWTVEDGSARVKIEKIGTKYFGKTIWMKEPNDENGKPKVDINNPDASLRNQPRIGLRIMKDFEHEGKGIFKNGNIYDPKKGKTYCGKITMKDNDHLDLRGSICGFGMLGRTSSWTRYKE
jgi:uncharacterized protein (DUF2147 family)